MAYSVKYADTAERQLKKLDAFDRKLILSWISKNLAGTQDPRARGKGMSENLAGYWRYRVGDYRIVCRIHDDVCEILVIQVGHRSKIYS